MTRQARLSVFIIFCISQKLHGIFQIPPHKSFPYSPPTPNPTHTHIREPWRRGGGHSTDLGLPDFREPWGKGGGRSQPPLRRDPLEPWRKGGGVM